MLNACYEAQFFKKRFAIKMMRIMNFGAILIFIFCLQVSARVSSQGISLDVKNVPLNKVFREINKQSGYTFIYTETMLKKSNKVSINVKNVSLQEVLAICFATQPLTYKIINQTVILQPKEKDEVNTKGLIDLPPPLIEIQGRVVNQQGQPLVGASVLVKGTGIGTKTDTKGNFNINADPKSILIVSFVGFQTREINVGNQTYIEIRLNVSIATSEAVVVVGFGSQLKKDLTGAISVISSKTFDDRPNTQFGNAIEGKAAGVTVVRPSGQPDAGFSMIIRGTSTITAGSNPIYIVNGVQTFNINEINPADIESISILKDASSSAIYGSSGANGVVLITTKQGRLGKTKVSFNPSITTSQAWRKLPVLNSSQYESLMNELGIGINWTNYTANTNWQDLVFRNALSQNYVLSISGGDEKTQFYLSGSLINQQGIVINSSVNRPTFNLNIDHKVSSFLKVGTNISYDRWKNIHIPENSRNGVIARLLTSVPIIGVWSKTNPVQYAYSPVAPVDVENPVAAAYQPQNLFINNRFHGNAYAEVSFLPDLKFKSLLGIEHWNSIGTSYQNTVQTSYGASMDGIATEDDESYDYWVTQNTLNYNKTIKDNSFSVLAGFIVSRINSREVNLSATGFGGSDAVQTVSAGTIQAVPQVNLIQQSKVSFIGRLTYSFKEKYLLTSNFRRDGSGQFSPNSRWQNFPSFSLGWRLSQENFLKNSTWLNDLKIRGGWGQVGNDKANPYAWYGTVNATSSYAIGTRSANGYAPSTQENQALKWEVTSQSDIGFDMSMLNRRVNITADYYDKKTKGLLLEVPIPASVGIPGNSALENAGSIENKGFEFQLTTKNIVSKNFSWSSDFNIYFNKGKVLNIVGTTLFSGEISPADNYQVAIVQAGLPLGSFYGKYSEGVDPSIGMIKFLQTKSGSDSMGVIGNANPKYSYGFTNSFRYKDFTLDIFLQGVQGNQIFNATRILSEAMSIGENQSSAVLKRWEKPGDITTIPKSTLQDNSNVYPSTRFIENGSYMRVKSITLAYNFPKKLIGKLKLTNLTLFITSENLLTFTKYSGFDPEMSAFGNGSNTDKNTAPGVDFGTYPQSRDFIFGFNLSF